MCLKILVVLHSFKMSPYLSLTFCFPCSFVIKMNLVLKTFMLDQTNLISCNFTQQTVCVVNTK